MSRNILDLPDEVLLTLIVSVHLTQREQYRFLALCKAWLPLLKDIRTYHVRDVEFFMDNETTDRQEIMCALGYGDSIDVMTCAT